MKSGLFVLSLILICSMHFTNLTKFEYTTIARTTNQQNTKLEKVIDSYRTPIRLNAVKDFNEIDKLRFKTVSSGKENKREVQSSLVNNINNASFNASSDSQRFKSVEQAGNKVTYGLDSTKLEAPVIIPYKNLSKLEGNGKLNAKENLSTQAIDENQISNNGSVNESTFRPFSVSKQSRKQDTEFGNDINLQNRINDASLQSVSNKEAFSAIYPDPEKFKDQVRLKVMDPDYASVKSAFEAKLDQILQENLIGMPIKSVDELKKPEGKITMTSKDFPSLKPEELDGMKDKLTEENSKTTLMNRRKGIQKRRPKVNN